jgi:hypothetical protein
MHMAKQFKWEGNSLLWVWTNEQVQIVSHPKQYEGLVWHVHENWDTLGFDELVTYFSHNSNGKERNDRFNNLFLNVW